MTEICADIFEAPDPATVRLGESRRQHRIIYCQQAWIVPINEHENHHSVMIHDISTIGVGFVSAAEFAPESWLLLTVPFPNNKWRKILCFTRRSERLDNGLYLTGAQFEAAMTIDGPSNNIPQSWMEWARDQRENRGKPAGSPVLESEIINSCGATEAEYY